MQAYFMPLPQCVCAQSCSIVFDSVGCSLPDSSVHGIIQARILEWVAVSISRVSSQTRDQICISYVAGRSFTIQPLGKL